MAISFRLNKKQNQLFNDAEQGLWRYPLALVFSLCLIFLDKTYGVVSLHQLLASAASPFQYVVDAPSRFAVWSRGVWSSKQALLAETRALHEEQLHLKAALQQLSSLQHENTILKSLLALSEQSKHPMMTAEVLAVETTRTRHVLVINKGKKNGVLLGQLVLDAEGVMGQVIEVGLMTSTVLLISDSASAVPVRNQRTGETAILAGTNLPERLSLIYLPKTASVETGDVLVTSGLGKNYPEGYPVGVVNKVENPLGEAFIRIDVKPFTRYHRSRMVLLVWPDEKAGVLKEEIKTRLSKQGRNGS
ncbi:MAG: rod shape-determining protein MreC [Legionellaceae bacterium]|nr:rod shape-determining protein MreC [Legionellaceae bacterium]